MVLNQTKDALIIVACALRAECDNDPLGGLLLHCAFGHREREHVAFICEELEGGGQVAVVDDVQETVCCLLDLNFAEMDTPS